MNTRFALFTAVVAGATILTGCNANQGFSNIGSAATRPASPQPANPALAPSPYELSAVASGPMVMFTVKNTGNQPLDIRRQDFALIVPGKGRRVIPFDDSVGTLDLQQGPLGPNATLHGRVLFRDVPAPAGLRLVYKPDEKGTFAIINAPAAAKS